MRRKKQGSVRIIAGRWRGTRLSVPDVPGLRPSGDRSREVLFNWLQAHLHGSVCADLFAGSGALGFEAASRGAASVVMLDTSQHAVQAIREAIVKLQADQIECLAEDAMTWLARQAAGSLDLVFIDPPFGKGLESEALHLLEQSGALKSSGLAYVETARDSNEINPGSAWEIVREKQLGEVRMQLLKKN